MIDFTKCKLVYSHLDFFLKKIQTLIILFSLINTETKAQTGNITLEVWKDVEGASVNYIPVNINPGTTTYLTLFEAPAYVGINYGQRISGYVCPPTTGNYIFWISSDDNGELWLSTNDSVSNKQKIAFVQGWTGLREWNKYTTQRSAPVYLTAGRKYYIEALHKQGNQGDHLSVGWQLPSAMLERPIPGNRLSPFSTQHLPHVSITSPEHSASFNEPASIQITATTSIANAAIKKVEFFGNGIKLGEDLSSPYAVIWKNLSAGNYSITAKVTDLQNLSSTSSVVRVTVSSASSGQISQTLLREYWNNFSGNLTQAPFHSPPTGSQQLTSFEAGPSNQDDYVSRIRGYVCPPATGNYTFWIASDDQSELWISTDENPSNKIKRAYVSDWTMPREWSKYLYQRSIPVYLVAGKKYYVEAIHREGNQGDHIAVGWSLPNGTLERPIPGLRLSTFTNSTSENTLPTVSITSPIPDERFSTPVNITLMADATDPDGNISKVEFYERNTKLGEINTAPFNFGWFNVITGTYTITAVAYDNTGAFSVSEPVKIEVTSCTTPLIKAEGATTFCVGESVVLNANPDYEQYQWKVNGIYSNEASHLSYLAKETGEYQVKTVKGSCVAWSAPVHVTANNCKSETEENVSGDKENLSKKSIKPSEPVAMKVYPNPNNGMFNVEIYMCEVKESKIDISVVNPAGQIILDNDYTVNGGQFKQQVELDKDLSAGVYVLKLGIGKNVETTRLILTK